MQCHSLERLRIFGATGFVEEKVGKAEVNADDVFKPPMPIFSCATSNAVVENVGFADISSTIGVTATVELPDVGTVAEPTTDGEDVDTNAFCQHPSAAVAAIVAAKIQTKIKLKL